MHSYGYMYDRQALFIKDCEILLSEVSVLRMWVAIWTFGTTLTAMMPKAAPSDLTNPCS